jgi:hypothetical protein
MSPGIAVSAVRRSGFRPMSHAGHVMPPRQRSWYSISLAEGVLLVLFSLLLGNLMFVLGGYEYWATPQDRVAYTVMASLVVPVVLVAGVHRLRRIVVYGESGASTNVFWSPHLLPLSTLLAGVAGAVSGWAGALLSRRLLTPGVSAGRRWTRAPTGAAP